MAYGQIDVCVMHRLRCCVRRCRITLGVFWGRFGLPLPRKQPIVTLSGQPIAGESLHILQYTDIPASNFWKEKATNVLACSTPCHLSSPQFSCCICNRCLLTIRPNSMHMTAFTCCMPAGAESLPSGQADLIPALCSRK